MRPRHAASIYPFLLFLPPRTGRVRGAKLHFGEASLPLSMTSVKFRYIILGRLPSFFASTKFRAKADQPQCAPPIEDRSTRILQAQLYSLDALTARAGSAKYVVQRSTFICFLV